MSRSYKRSPYVTDGSNGRKGHGRPMKVYAEKKIRHTKDLPTRSRGAYKKYFCSYDICDYKWSFTKEEAIEQWLQEESDYPCWKTSVFYKSTGETHTDKYGFEWPSYEKIVDEEYIEVGPLHKQYGTLEKYLYNYWKKFYYRK